MSQRGRGSGPHDDDPDDEDAEQGQERDAGEVFFSAAARPIAPYDPYRSSSGDTSRRPVRNVASEDYEPPIRRPYRGDTPFLDDDDPLNADAWQIELEEVDTLDAGFEGPLPAVEREPRRRERRPTPTRVGRGAESEISERRAPRRSRAGSSGARERAQRGAVTIAVPRAVSGSSLVADQVALALLAVNVVSVLLMALLLGVRLGGMPNPTVLRLDAAGNPDRWGPPSVLWRLPVMAFFTTVMFLVVSWFLHPLDRFAARFALGAALVAQLVTWVALIQHIFGS
jgi:hypothetical protein